MMTMHEALKKIFTVNLGVKKEESVLVFTDIVGASEDLPYEDKKRRLELQKIARDVCEAGIEFCTTHYFEFPSVMGHGKEPPLELWEAAFGARAVKALSANGLLKKIIEKKAEGPDLKTGAEIIRKFAKTPDAVIALSNFSTSHTRFRDYLTGCMNTRYVSMPLFDKEMLNGAMSADWGAVEARTNRVVDKLSGADTVIITSHNGTSISFSIKDRQVQPDTGILTKPGSFGNLPAGEAFLAPVEGTAEGTLILEWAPTHKLKHPIELDVKGGRVVEVSGKDVFARELQGLIASNPLMGNIAELGIGTNDKAKRPDNIIETEKILGTIHIALGDNSSFGGTVSVPFHEDFIFFKPTVEAIKCGEKIEIIIEGEPRF